MVVHIYNPGSWGDQGRRIVEFKASLNYIEGHCLKKEKQKQKKILPVPHVPI
jgi:hypothetical protein